MARAGTIVLTYRVTNAKAVRAFGEALQLVDEIVESQPWNEEARQAKRLLKRAVRGLVAKTRRSES